jgi:hypothetical protein
MEKYDPKSFTPTARVPAVHNQKIPLEEISESIVGNQNQLSVAILSSEKN